MKNYNEMANNVFERRDQYETEKKQRRKILTRIITPICCICIVALLGMVFGQGKFFANKPVQSAEDSVVQGEKDWYGPGESEPSNHVPEDGGKKEMNLVYENRRYVEVTNLNYNELEIGEKIGNGEDFEGTYTTKYLNERYGTYVVDGDTIRITITSEVYTVKNNPDILCIKLSNGDIDYLKTYPVPE